MLNKGLVLLVVLLLIFSVGLLGYVYGSFSKMTGATILTGQVINQVESIAPGVSADSEWKAITDQKIVLNPDTVYKAFSTVKGEEVSMKYSVESDLGVEIHFVKSEAECDEVASDLTFEVHYNCEPSNDKVFKYSSGVCNVPSDFGICVINRNTGKANVNVSIEKKI